MFNFKNLKKMKNFRKLVTMTFIILGMMVLLTHSLNAQVNYSNCSASGTNSALGSYSEALGGYSFAFGQYTRASVANSYVFGSGSNSSNRLVNSVGKSFLIGFSNTPIFMARLTNNEPRVGIGNTAPTVALDVTGDIKAQSVNATILKVGSRVEFTQPELSFVKIVNSPGDTSISINPSDPMDTKSSSISNGYGMNYILTMKGTNVGIGTNNPSAKLHVSGHSYLSGGLRIKSISDYDEADIAVKNKWFFTSGTSNVIGHNWRTNPTDSSDMIRAYYGAASAMFFNGNGDISFRTIGAEPITSQINSWQEVIMKNNGYLGIGTSAPKTKFQIGNIWTFHDGVNDKIIGRNCYYNGENNVRIQSGVASRIFFSSNGDIVFQTAAQKGANTMIDGDWKSIYIKNNGSLGINTDDVPASYKLAINGKMICEEVTVILRANWPDYVFDNNYNLKPLEEVAEFIQEHKHLPEIPSAAQVEENGVGLAEMNALLLKKVEELTLYIIEQNKQISEQNQRIDALEDTLRR
jgi:hypothetical protein